MSKASGLLQSLGNALRNLGIKAPWQVRRVGMVGNSLKSSLIDRYIILLDVDADNWTSIIPGVPVASPQGGGV